jgi:hypothetical protein
MYEENELDEERESVHTEVEEAVEVTQRLERARRDLEGETGRTVTSWRPVLNP